MTYTVHDPRVVYDAIISRLTSETGKNIGRVEAPSDRTTPYAVVYPRDDTGDPTSVGDAHETTVYEFQVTSVADTAEQAEWMQTETRTALVGWTPTVTGRSFNPVEKAGGLGTARDDSVQPPKFMAVDIYTLFTS